MLLHGYTDDLIEAGCDEAGRGCLAGPVFAAAVILPKDYAHAWLNDSKQITEKRREHLRADIEAKALSWCVARCEPEEIDEMNILNASIEAMHRALKGLKLQPQLILVDGNRFHPYRNLPHHTIVQGDGIFSSIAAASILAKTHRDEYMGRLDVEFPAYGWKRNKGYPSREHRDAIAAHGVTPHHRKSFRLNEQMRLF